MRGKNNSPIHCLTNTLPLGQNTQNEYSTSRKITWPWWKWRWREGWGEKKNVYILGAGKYTKTTLIPSASSFIGGNL